MTQASSRASRRHDGRRFKLSVPLLVSGLGVGLVISVLQAVTQMQEMTLTFVPKVIVAAIVLAMMGPWMLEHAHRVHPGGLGAHPR